MFNNPQDNPTPELVEKEVYGQSTDQPAPKGTTAKDLSLFQVDISVHDLDMMMDFYTALLGLDKTERFINTHRERRTGSVQLPNSKIVLVESTDPADTPRSDGGIRRITLSTGDERNVNEMYRRVCGMAKPPKATPPHYDSDNRYKITVTDPEGNEIAFCD